MWSCQLSFKLQIFLGPTKLRFWKLLLEWLLSYDKLFLRAPSGSLTHFLVKVVYDYSPVCKQREKGDNFHGLETVKIIKVLRGLPR